jgi:hypothetical protein
VRNGPGPVITGPLSETALQEAHKLQGPRVVGTSEVKALLALEKGEAQGGHFGAIFYATETRPSSYAWATAQLSASLRDRVVRRPSPQGQ